MIGVTNYDDKLNAWYQDYIVVAILLYLTVATGLGFLKSNINLNVLYLQILSLLTYFIYIKIGLRLSLFNTILLTFFYQIILSYTLYFDFRYILGDVLGYNPVDSKLYSVIALNSSSMSFTDFIKYLNNYFDSLSDYGFPIFLRYIYIFFPNVVTAQILLILCNCIFQTIVCYITWQIICFIKIDYITKKWILVLWGGNPCSIYLNAAGLKEPLFCLLCMVAIYFIYKFNKHKKIKTIFFLVISILCTWFFRYYMSLFLFLIFYGFCVAKKLYKKYFASIILISFVLCVGFTSILIEIFPEIYYVILQTEEMLPSGVGKYFYYLLAFLSPIPKFFNMETPQMLLVVGYSIVKFAFSVFAIIGSIYIIKYKRLEFFPLINICVFTIIMLIVSGHYINYRYFYPIMPCFFILMVYGVRYCKRWIAYSYLVCSAFIIVLFNLQLY